MLFVFQVYMTPRLLRVCIMLCQFHVISIDLGKFNQSKKSRKRKTLLGFRGSRLVSFQKARICASLCQIAAKVYDHRL